MNFKSVLRFLNKKQKKKIFVFDQKDLHFLEKELSNCKFFALDTEFDWRTTYFPKLSLIQISVNETLFLIDCLNVNPKNSLKKYLEDSNILKIFHSVRSDTIVLSKCLDSNTQNVFDIQIADILLTNEGINSYANIVKKFFYIKLKKSETNSNWLKRPLTQNQLEYALDDVDFLVEIYQYQRKILTKRNLLEKAFLDSEKEAFLGNQPLKKIRLMKQENKLSKRNKEIFEWREELAEEENIPPAFIFKNKYLKKLSKIQSNDKFAKKKLMAILGDNLLVDKFMTSFL
tara:strand:+ start:4819 stop:5679 length:861 start_codon:yes stop_codon:yes gene_type:complete